MTDTAQQVQGQEVVRGVGRAVAVLGVGLGVGVITAFTTGAMANPVQGIGAVGFWGLVFAVPAGLTASAVTLAVVGGGSRMRQAGLYALATVLGLFGAIAAWWNILWGVPPASLEGAWLWPLAVVPMAGAALAWKAARRRRAGPRSSHGG